MELNVQRQPAVVQFVTGKQLSFPIKKHHTLRNLFMKNIVKCVTFEINTKRILLTDFAMLLDRMTLCNEKTGVLVKDSSPSDAMAPPY
jgi:hypothetical protein